MVKPGLVGWSVVIAEVTDEYPYSSCIFRLPESKAQKIIV
jgi:hypothetical protein